MIKAIGGGKKEFVKKKKPEEPASETELDILIARKDGHWPSFFVILWNR